MKNCFSLPKLQYILRCAPCYKSQILQRYDNSIRETLQLILNIELSDSAWNQATLPVKNGGIGIRLAKQVALPAYLSSIASSDQLILQFLPARLHSTAGSNDQLFTDAVDTWRKRAGGMELPQLAINQKAWDMPLVGIAMDKVLSCAPNQAGIARLTAASAPYSGAFLQALPCSSIGTRLDDASLRIAIAIRLGATVCAPHTCICGATVESSGIHGLSCRKSACRIIRHNSLNDLIKRSLQRQKFHPDSNQHRCPDPMASVPMEYL